VLDLLFEPTPALLPIAQPLLASLPSSSASPAAAAGVAPQAAAAAPQAASYDAFIDAVRARLHALAASIGESDSRSASDDDNAGDGELQAKRRSVLEAILAAHPRLGEKRVDSAMSRMEQARMAAATAAAVDAAVDAAAAATTNTAAAVGATVGASGTGTGADANADSDNAAAAAAAGQTELAAPQDGGQATREDEHRKKLLQEAEAEAQMLRALNREYEERFPGLRYVVFVNGRPRSVIMDDMRARIARGDVMAERREAVDAMCDIAKDRCRKLGVEG
jgi:2-oxo-4-hydroxy-4-carboxy--5-ureidoimidazoline (OHCU) decarboxylase